MDSGLSEDQFKTLRSKVEAYQAIQKRRIGLGNMIFAWENRIKQAEKAKALPMHLQSDEFQIVENFYGDVRKFMGNIGYEGDLKKDIEILGRNTKLWVDWLQHVRGIGTFYTGVLVGFLYDKEFHSRSALIKYFGHHVIDGKKARRYRGKKTDYDPMKQAMGYNIGNSLLRLKNPGGYRLSGYDRIKSRLTERHPDWIKPDHTKGWLAVSKDKRFPGRLHKAARSQTFKLFLSHLWELMYRHKHPGEPIPLPMHYRDVPYTLKDYIPPIYDGEGDNPFDPKFWTYTNKYPGVNYK